MKPVQPAKFAALGFVATFFFWVTVGLTLLEVFGRSRVEDHHRVLRMLNALPGERGADALGSETELAKRMEKGGAEWIPLAPSEPTSAPPD